MDWTSRISYVHIGQYYYHYYYYYYYYYCYYYYGQDWAAVGWIESLSQDGHFPVLQLGPDSVTASDHIRLLGAMIAQ